MFYFLKAIKNTLQFINPVKDLELLKKIMPNVIQSMVKRLNSKLNWQEDRVRFLKEDLKKSKPPVWPLKSLNKENKASILSTTNPKTSSIEDGSMEHVKQNVEDDLGRIKTEGSFREEKRVIRIHSAKVRQNSDALDATAGQQSKLATEPFEKKNFSNSAARLPPRPKSSSIATLLYSKSLQVNLETEERRLDDSCSRNLDESKRKISRGGDDDDSKIYLNLRVQTESNLSPINKDNVGNKSPSKQGTRPLHDRSKIKTSSLTRTQSIPLEEYESTTERLNCMVNSKELVNYRLVQQEKEAKYEETLLIDPEKVYFLMTVRGSHAQKKGLKKMLGKFYEKKKFKIEDKISKDFLKEGSRAMNVEKLRSSAAEKSKPVSRANTTAAISNTANSFSRAYSSKDSDKNTLNQCEKVLRYVQTMRPSSAQQAKNRLEREKIRQYEMVNIMTQLSPVSQDIIFNNLGGKEAMRTVHADFQSERILDLLNEENRAINEKKADIVRKMFKPPYFKKLDRPAVR